MDVFIEIDEVVSELVDRIKNILYP